MFRSDCGPCDGRTVQRVSKKVRVAQLQFLSNFPTGDSITTQRHSNAPTRLTSRQPSDTSTPGHPIAYSKIRHPIATMNAPFAPPGAAWQEHRTPDGRVYYYNPLTKVTQWTKPEDLMGAAEVRAFLPVDGAGHTGLC